MTKLSSTIVVLACIVGLSAPLLAQQQPTTRANSSGGRSPHETTGAVIEGNRVTITYGRPNSKDPSPRGRGAIRKIWGTLVPWDKAWRMGSDEATTLITQQPLAFGDTTIPAGAHTIYMIPSENGTSKLVFSKQLGQWGIKQDGTVDESGEFAKIDLKKEALPQQLDQLTIAVERNPAGGGQIKISWESTAYTAAFTIKK